MVIMHELLTKKTAHRGSYLRGGISMETSNLSPEQKEQARHGVPVCSL